MKTLEKQFESVMEKMAGRVSIVEATLTKEDSGGGAEPLATFNPRGGRRETASANRDPMLVEIISDEDTDWTISGVKPLRFPVKSKSGEKTGTLNILVEDGHQPTDAQLELFSMLASRFATCMEKNG